MASQAEQAELKALPIQQMSSSFGENFGDSNEVLEPESPMLSEYESEGTLARKRLRQNMQLRVAKNVSGIARTCKVVECSDEDDDDVPLVSLVQKVIDEMPTRQDDHDCSDGDDDNVPLLTLVRKPKLNVLADVSAIETIPTAQECIELEVTRDFGGEHGASLGKIVRVDVQRRRPLYHVVYTETVLTCPKLAAQVYNVKRIYCDHNMAVWLQKNPHRKYDSIAKKVRV